MPPFDFAFVISVTPSAGYSSGQSLTDEVVVALKAADVAFHRSTRGVPPLGEVCLRVGVGVRDADPLAKPGTGGGEGLAESFGEVFGYVFGYSRQP